MGVGRRKSAVAAMVVGAAGLLVVQLGDPAHAQQASSSVLPGTASAGAALVGVVPQVSGLTLTTTLGEADAAYEEQEAQAKSGIVDLGGLGYFLAGTDFCGAKGLPLSEQPQPLSADSQNGATTRTQSVAGQGAETVSVSPQPERASATTTPAIEVLPGVLEVSGREEATVQYVAGTEQEADASVVEDVAFLNGLVQLNGLTWTASRRAGGTNESSVSFSLGQVIINHVPLDRSGLSTAAAVALVNDVIGVFGFTISLPAASSDPVNGSVSMGPLVVQFSGSRVDRALLSPSVATITQLEAALAAQSTPGTDCSQFRQLLYNVGNNIAGDVNLVLLMGQGAGGLFLDLGGANASIESLPAYANPFGSPGLLRGLSPMPPSNVTALTVSPTSITAGPSSSTAAGQATQGGVQATTPPSIRGEVRGPSAGGGTVSVAGVVLCHTTSPAGSPGCWRGLGSIAAGVTVVAGVTLLAAEVVYGRRRSRRRRRSYA
jgi:hypothetical protein